MPRWRKLEEGTWELMTGPRVAQCARGFWIGRWLCVILAWKLIEL